jgi:D-alanyl-lipoteichoic acid acyltransferase DltB (MBOAT superfamily)
LILLGLFKKVAIADALAPIVHGAFNNSGRAGWSQLLLGFYGFGLQVYGDFSGYSDIARGSSRLFGIELLRNFEQPFLSRSMTELWRTWHISLSTWLRDYVFVPLGGSRVKKTRAYMNTMILMLVAGLWHGAKWTFVAWGAINGVYLIVERILTERSKRDTPRETPIGGPMGTLPIDVRHETSVEAAAIKTAHRKEAPLPPPFRWTYSLQAIRTFTLFCLAAVFFRAETFTEAWQFLTGLVTLRAGPLDANSAALVVLAALLSFAIDITQRNARDETPVIQWNLAARAAVYATLFVTILVFSGGTPTEFIYFNF